MSAFQQLFPYLNTKVILDALDSQVLTKGAELVVDVLIVGPLLLPLADQHLQCLVQHWFGTHFARVWCRSQSEVRLLNDLALALQQIKSVKARQKAADHLL